MPSVSMRQLLEAGVHFGHQTRRWNPKMKPYIFAERNGIHIIDLAQTVQRLDAALQFVTDTVAGGDTILFVGTKKQAQEPIAEEAARADMPYVNQRWLGGMLTNFVTIRKRLGLLDQMEARQANGEFERLTKKEASKLTDEMARLQRTLGGMRKMRRLPGALFVVDPHREHIAVTEARKLEIPVIGTGDTNVDPDQLDFIIPANDDAIRAIRLLCRVVADAAIEGAGSRAARAADQAPMSAEVAEAEEASDELVAALAAGGTFSFAPDRGGGGPPARRTRGRRRRSRRRDNRALSPRPGGRPECAAPPADPGSHHSTKGSTHTWLTSRRSSPNMVKELRERTGAGFMDCKRALEETGGDLDKAVTLLRERGVAAAAKKAGRDAREGLVSSYIHSGGRLGVLIEVNCETDFVARNEDFQKLVRDLAMQVAGVAPEFVTIESIPAEVTARKRAELLADESVASKPEAIREKIVEGQLRKWHQQVVLYEQPFRDTDQTVGQLITDAIAKIGENIRVRRFTRYQLGEEL